MSFMPTETQKALTYQINQAFAQWFEESGGIYTPTKRNKNTNLFSEFLNNKMAVIRAISEGIPYNLFALIAQLTPFTEEDWSKFLSLSSKSLQRYKQNEQRFKPLQSEKIIALAEVTRMGEDVMGSTKAFMQWLETPNYALGKVAPMSLLSNAYGKDLVMAELHRINHGILV